MKSLLVISILAFVTSLVSGQDNSPLRITFPPTTTFDQLVEKKNEAAMLGYVFNYKQIKYDGANELKLVVLEVTGPWGKDNSIITTQTITAKNNNGGGIMVVEEK